MADYDQDGDIDIYAPGARIYGSEGALLRNERGQQLHWLKIALVGTESARDAYGARVTVRTGRRRPCRAGARSRGLGINKIASELAVGSLTVRRVITES